MKPLVIYHASCADGFGAAFAAWLKLDDAEYVPMQYGEQANNFDLDVSGREVYVLDFSFPKLTMNRLFSTAQRVVWLDHHRTAFEMWCEDGERSLCEQSNGRDEVILDNNKSGAMLAWEYFHPGTEVPMLIQHIDDRDRWQFKLSGTKEFHAGLWSRPFSFDAWARIYFEPGYEDRAIQYTILEGNTILRANDQNVQAVLAGQMDCKISTCSHQHGPDIADTVQASWSDGYLRRFDGLACNTPGHLCSDVGHELAKKSGTFGLCWRMQDDGRIKCELRSDSDYDVSAIAKAFGGGGHAQAAGFFTDLETLKGWLK